MNIVCTMASPSEHERSVANLAAAIIAPPVKKRNRLKLRDEPVLVKIMQESGVKAKRQVERKKKAKLDASVVAEQKQHAVTELEGRHQPELLPHSNPNDRPDVPRHEMDRPIEASEVPVQLRAPEMETTSEQVPRVRRPHAQRHVRGVDIAPQVHEYLLKRNGPYYRLQFAAAAGLVAGAAAYSYAPAIVAALNM
jgi:hypothetical protein